MLATEGKRERQGVMGRLGHAPWAGKQVDDRALSADVLAEPCLDLLDDPPGFSKTLLDEVTHIPEPYTPNL